MSYKSCPFLYSDWLYKNGLNFLEIKDVSAHITELEISMVGVFVDKPPNTIVLYIVSNVIYSSLGWWHWLVDISGLETGTNG